MCKIGLEYLSHILNNTAWKQIYLMYNDNDCRGKRYSQLIDALKYDYGAKSDAGNSASDLRASLFNVISSTASNNTLTEITRARWNVSDIVFDTLHDVSMLMAYKKLVIPKSTFGFWGGFLSNATEVSRSLFNKNAM
jgi:hypothetical protein